MVVFFLGEEKTKKLVLLGLGIQGGGYTSQNISMFYAHVNICTRGVKEY